MTPQTHSVLYYIVYWLISAVAVLITSKVIRGFKVDGFWSAVFAALIIGLVNTVIWPILFFLTLPINVLTLGLFTFVINGIVIKLAAALLPGFDVEGWWPAIFGALFFSIINTLLHYFFI
ncbi:MAG: phage holin family protein [Bdellovibrionaceae bacterium]|nr:phage holin family protein [Bdellovibrio sp.]